MKIRALQRNGQTNFVDFDEFIWVFNENLGVCNETLESQ